MFKNEFEKAIQMTNRRYRILRSNACRKTGRPQRGFEKWRARRRDAEPITFLDYLKLCFSDIEKQHGNISLWYYDGQTWYPYETNKKWNYVIAEFSGQDKVRKVDDFLEDYRQYKKDFWKWQSTAEI